MNTAFTDKSDKIISHTLTVALLREIRSMNYQKSDKKIVHVFSESLILTGRVLKGF